ncbi:MAG: DUF5689 domain-containing protein [Muribaculaceae bacterium]|nr:DUF5689 domain-containing protein [Muribaculaceae bacterium]
MKNTLLYIAAAALGVSALLSSCDDDFTTPPVVMPPTENVESTMTLPEFKAEYWKTITAPQTLGTLADGDSIILTGRVCSSDESGNIFKNIVVQTVDENGKQYAINFSVDEYDLYTIFPFGQEVAIKATGMSIGGYRGLMTFGVISGDQADRMPLSTLKAHMVRNRMALPEPAKVDTTITTIATLNAAKSNQNDLMEWQSRLIRIDGVSFEDAGQQYAPSATTDRYIKDDDGNRINVRCSSFASFKNDEIPYGKGSVTGILSYYGTNWQILLNDVNGVEGFDNEKPDVPEEKAEGDGTKENPYNAVAALTAAKALAADAQSEKDVYVKGKVVSIKELSTQFGNATYNIGDSEGGTTFNIYRGLGLNGAKFTSEDQLAVGAEVVVCGKLVNYKGNTPQMAQGSSIVSYNGQTGGDNPGGDNPGGDTPSGDGTEANPYNAVAALAATRALAADATTESSFYVKGKIISINELSTQFGNATYNIGDSEGGTTFNIYRGLGLNGAKFTSEDQLAVGAEVVVCGKLVNYKGNTPQMAQGSSIVSYNGQTGGGDNPGGSDNPDVPSGEVITVNASSFDGKLPGSITVDGYTINIEKASGSTNPAYHTNTTAVRTYAKNTITVSGPKAAKIVFHITADNNFRYTTVTPTSGKMDPAQAVGDTTATWVGDSTDVTFTVGEIATLGSESTKPGQFRFTKIEIFKAE